MREAPEPKLVTLQVDHVCCRCGVKLLAGNARVRVTVPLSMPHNTSTAVDIAWCQLCWREQCSSDEMAAAVPDRTC
jgi:hypothetical protein